MGERVVFTLECARQEDFAIGACVDDKITGDTIELRGNGRQTVAFRRDGETQRQRERGVRLKSRIVQSQNAPRIIDRDGIGREQVRTNQSRNPRARARSTKVFGRSATATT